MEISCFSLGQLQANCYFFTKDNNCIIIDPADDASFILEQVQRKKLKLLAMLVTHGHFDHLLAVGEIQMSFEIPFYIFEEDLFLIKRLNQTTEHFLGYNPQVIEPKKINYLKEGEMKIKSFEFEVIKTPGHTPGSCCFYFKKEKVIFTGDTLFQNAIGRYDFSYSSKIDIFTSVEKILHFPDNTQIYSGHGDKTDINAEKQWIRGI